MALMSLGGLVVRVPVLVVLALILQVGALVAVTQEVWLWVVVVLELLGVLLVMLVVQVELVGGLALVILLRLLEWLVFTVLVGQVVLVGGVLVRLGLHARS